MSDVWKHFEIPADTPDSGNVRIKCKLCAVYISGNIRSTSNFATHLKRKHRDIYLQARTEDGTPTQSSMENFVRSSNAKKYLSSDPNQQIITDALVTFIAGNLTPLSIIDSPEFKTLVEALDPKYQIPSRKHLSTKLLYQKSTKIQSSLKKQLRSVENVCLTIDLWSNRQMKGFLGITGHYIMDWCMKSIMVSCKRFKGSHCAENIRQEYEEAVASYNIANKITHIITDNASNMVKAFDFSLPGYTVDSSLDEQTSNTGTLSDSEDEEEDNELNSVEIDFPDNDLPKHGRCFAHTLQLVVKDGLKEASPHLKTVISKASVIVKHVRKSISASEKLEGEKRLQSDNQTRWNSQIKMNRSVLDVPNSKLNKLDTVHLTDYERNVLTDLCLLLKPFEDATVMVQTDTNVSGSLAIPVTLGLEHKLSELSTRYNNKMVSTLISSTSKRLAIYKDDDVYQVSAMLDPRFKLRWSKDPIEMEDKLLAYARKQQCISDQLIDECSPPKKMHKSDDTGLFSFMTPTKERRKHVSGDSVRIEVSQYLVEPCIDGIDPLQYWKENAGKYPTLANLAKNYLALPATSAAVEKLFSVADKFFRPDRCRLNDSTFQMLMMIKCNAKKI